MLAIKDVLVVVGLVLLVTALGIALYDLWKVLDYPRKLARIAAVGDEGSKKTVMEPGPVRWQTCVGLVIVACLPLLIVDSIVVIPAGMGGVRVSQIRGTLPGTLYAGAHFVTPLVDSVQIFDLRDKLFTSGLVEGLAVQAKAPSAQPLDVQSKEGLDISLAITVRYRLDPRRLDYIQSHLPQPVDAQMVPAVVASAWRDLAPGYTVREIFSTDRERVRQQAAGVITKKLGADGIIVEEVMLRNIQLPPEYAKGLEDLLLKEQQDDQMAVQTDIQQKQVRIAELQAEAEAAQKVKEAEGDAHAKVVEAKGEADAMQYTLPLKQKQIEQSKLEAEARKEATIENADAEAQAKVIDSKAEVQRRNLLTDAEANRIRVTAAADADRMASEAKMLNQSPLLINKIIAERLSDKIQMVMVPSDGKYFFASDVFKGMGMAAQGDNPTGQNPGRSDTPGQPANQ